MHNIFLNTITSKEEREQRSLNIIEENGSEQIKINKNILKTVEYNYNNISYNILTIDVGEDINYDENEKIFKFIMPTDFKDKNGNIYYDEYCIYDGKQFIIPTFISENSSWTKSTLKYKTPGIAFNYPYDPYFYYKNGSMLIEYVAKLTRFNVVNKNNNLAVLNCDIIQSKNSLILNETPSPLIYKITNIGEETVNGWDCWYCDFGYNVNSDKFINLLDNTEFIFTTKMYSVEYNFIKNNMVWEGNNCQIHIRNRLVNEDWYTTGHFYIWTLETAESIIALKYLLNNPNEVLTYGNVFKKLLDTGKYKMEIKFYWHSSVANGWVNAYNIKLWDPGYNDTYGGWMYGITFDVEDPPNSGFGGYWYRGGITEKFNFKFYGLKEYNTDDVYIDYTGKVKLNNKLEDAVFESLKIKEIGLNRKFNVKNKNDSLRIYLLKNGFQKFTNQSSPFSNPFENLAKNYNYSIIPKSNAASYLYTPYNIRSDGIILAQNIETQAREVNDIGNNIEIAQNDIKDINDKINQINEAIKKIQEKLDAYNIVNSVLSFASNIAGIAFGGFGIGLIKDVSEGIEAVTSVVSGVDKLVFGEIDSNGNPVNNASTIDKVVNINPSDQIPTNLTESSVLNSVSTQILINKILENYTKTILDEKLKNYQPLSPPQLYNVYIFFNIIYVKIIFQNYFYK